ncbi:overexpressed in colon carcinoma 1 protein homolog [Sphaeramia orbicularis]|uniref:overexpressed in colon carcinoma 1 protein homolog n=1 Tax=Sphaeramia orbicularis TaxID=375764 RepID=UPI0011806EEC|nr:overexpressed in colon carcinoma 1 protein homolog [Sphaeramia orbicularis]XP_030006121.1 overexpressed in colon carcinoma 1 protein homolog [Sphaeramia orbicularis]
MGCGNSSPSSTSNSSNSSSKTGHVQSLLSKVSEDSTAEDDKRKNYGGVYVGLPTDLSNIPQVQIGSLRETEQDPNSLRKPLWGNGL